MERFQEGRAAWSRAFRPDEVRQEPRPPVPRRAFFETGLKRKRSDRHHRSDGPIFRSMQCVALAGKTPIVTRVAPYEASTRSSITIRSLFSARF
jgi:hypothetical protein